MSRSDVSIIVSLYIRGPDLDPDIVTKRLGIVPSRTQRNGETRTTSSNRDYVTKLGLWALISNIKSNLVNENLRDLIKSLPTQSDFISGIPGAQEAYFDVFIASEADDAAEGGCEFEISADVIAGLSKFGLPVRFSFAVVKE